MFPQDRTQLRQMFFSAWQKYNTKQAMEPLEQLIASIIEQHPEYHALLSNPQDQLDKDYTPEMGQTNPFLHMAMHISIQEQLGTQRPAGVITLYQSLLAKLGDAHEVEHQMMECLGQMIWEAQRNNTMPNEQTYIDCLNKLLSTV
ncbi:MAG: DUF1841 family protein [Gammaproteobacteria bacterium]|nr:DUF1841 family protein [Gammaproteobacteria bacterium]